jgi:hypothetical protein
MQGTMIRGETLARKAGRPKKKGGEGKAVRIDPDLVNKARVIAMRQGIAVSDYLSGLLEAPIARDYRKTLQELAAENEKGAK